MQLTDLVKEYQQIRKVLHQKWPIERKQERIFARMMKLVEELGELSDAILSSLNLQRSSKMSAFQQQDLEDEFADLMGTLVLLGIELDIDLETVMKRKIEFTKQRLDAEETEVK